MDVENACKIIRELVAVNLTGVELAREVMLAQETADELEHAAQMALARLHSEPRDGWTAPSEDALDETVTAFTSADSANAAEMAASTAYAANVERSLRVVAEARRLVAELDPPATPARGADARPRHPLPGLAVPGSGDAQAHSGAHRYPRSSAGNRTTLRLERRSTRSRSPARGFANFGFATITRLT